LISEDLCDQLVHQRKTSQTLLFPLQANVATDTDKDAHLVTYIRYVLYSDAYLLTVRLHH